LHPINLKLRQEESLEIRTKLISMFVDNSLCEEIDTVNAGLIVKFFA